MGELRQLFRGEGFGQRRPAAVGIGDDLLLTRKGAAPEDDGHSAEIGVGLKFRSDGMAVFVRQPDIEENDVGAELAGRRKSPCAEILFVHDEGIRLFQHEPAEMSEGRFVVDEQDAPLSVGQLNLRQTLRLQRTNATGDQARDAHHGRGCGETFHALDREPVRCLFS